MRAAVVAVLLALSSGCGDATIAVGPIAPSDPCDFWRGSCGPSTVTGELTYREDGMVRTPSPVTAHLIGPLVTLTGGESPRSVEITVWATETGVFRCEDPATAGRTHIRVDNGFDTTLGGTCVITISHFPTPDDARLVGTFSAAFDSDQFVRASKLEGGSFSLSGVERY